MGQIRTRISIRNYPQTEPGTISVTHLTPSCLVLGLW
jgi:hypothetical protein